MNQSFQVSGMTCGHCEMAVKRAVKQLDPAADIQIDRSTGKVDVQSEQPREQLVKAIADEDMDRSNETKTSAVHFLRFEFSREMIAALRAGAALHFASTHPHCLEQTEVTGETRTALLADFD